MTAWVADYTSRIAPAALKAAGVVGVVRYVSRSSWKVIGKAEYDELTAAGIVVLLNFEDESNGWMGGKQAGADDAAFAASEAKTLGYPATRPIPSSADFNMTATQWSSAGRAYAIAYRDGIRARDYTEGVYGPWDVLTWCKTLGYAWNWQAGMSTAWSGGRNAKPWPGAHLRQRRHMTVGGHDTDWNDILQQDWSGDGMAGLTGEQAGQLINADAWAYALATLQDTANVAYGDNPAAVAAADVPAVKLLKDMADAMTRLGAAQQTGGVDLDALATALAPKVAALLPKPPTAAEIADELAARLKD